MSSAYLELAKRCEEASGPDRELDVLIAERCGGHLSDTIAELRAGSPLNTTEVIASCADGPCFAVPAYTASLDAAMTLVPEGYAWTVSSFISRGPRAEVYDKNAVGGDADAETPALALCAASLKSKGAGDQ